MKEITESKKFNKNLRDKMSIEIVDVDNIDYDCCNGLRGATCIKKSRSQSLVRWWHWHEKKKNPYDRFANSGSAKIPGKIGRVVVGYIPRELSRYMWHALDSGVIISGKIISDKFKSSPLFQGGLEIPIKVKLVRWKIYDHP